MKSSSSKRFFSGPAIRGYAEGIKVENISLNIFRTEGNGNMLLFREYRLGIPVKKEKFSVEDCEEAEDRIDLLKCKYGVILKFREKVRNVLNSHPERG